MTEKWTHKISWCDVSKTTKLPGVTVIEASFEKSNYGMIHK
jgi:hypothetical protein